MAHPPHDDPEAAPAPAPAGDLGEGVFRRIVESAPDFISLHDAAGRVLHANPAIRRYVGKSVEQMREVSALAAGGGPPWRERLFAGIRAVLRSGTPEVVELVFPPDAGGTELHHHVQIVPLLDGEGRVEAVASYGRDVTAVRAAERELAVAAARQDAARELLHRREQEFRALVENAPDPVSRYDREGRRLYVNPAFRRLFPGPEGALGRTPAEAAGLAPESGARLAEAIRRVGAGGEQRTLEVSWTDREGGVRYHQVTVVAELDRDGAVATVLAVGRDITALKRSEEELRKLSRAVEQSPSSIMITDPAGRIVYVNPKFCRLTGYAPEEVVGRTPSLLKSGETPPGEYERLWRTVLGGGEWRGELHNRKKGGELYWESASISPILGPDGRITHLLAVKEDVTERKRLEEDLRRAQKMEAFGQLAGGVAHDFNNVLTVIQGAAAALEAPALSAEERAALAAEILQASDRAARLTRQLLLFSRKKPAQLRALDLNAVVADTADMLRRLIGEHLTLETRLAPGGAPVQADLGMLEQVLMNLVVNARDAMPRGGRVVVETGTADGPTGPRVRLVVRDTGGGISPEHLPHVFEPFFTTKDVGKGTGLGLATVFGIVQQHGGTIDVASRVGEGTAVEIELPRLAGAAPAPAAARPAPGRGGGETLLLVEDDPPVRALARRVLEGEGYRVLEASSAGAALEVWAARRDEIALVVTDMVMPGGMGGWEMGERMRAERPRLPIVYSSGYTEDVLGDLSALRGTARMLDKPYDPAALARAVRACLDEAQDRG